MSERTFPPLSLEGLQTYSLQDRPSKVRIEEFARPWQAGGLFKNFIDSLPAILAAQDFRAVVAAILAAAGNRKTLHWAMGAHLIKVGLSPLLIDLMQKGLITALSLNGAGVVHDSELAMVGRTSEDVDQELGGGTFGMARETAEFLNRAVTRGASQGLGLGRAVGEALLAEGFPHLEASLLATAAREGIPATVHVAIGTDIIHLHPSLDPEATGRATYRDFQTFCSVVQTLEGGVFLNIGSAVILPEIFLKAVTLVRNLGWPLKKITTVNFDFIRHYRPATNVVRRPTLEGGRGYYLIGHHELMIPLLAAAVLEGWGR
ncbi:MAG: hypothetical protein MUF69_13210 [Desulfobacterota bacterium]|jgi:hypothetical protein|nr:hypothetical protein [Thermodesulfobacteriota bacterium]